MNHEDAERDDEQAKADAVEQLQERMKRYNEDHETVQVRRRDEAPSAE